MIMRPLSRKNNFLLNFCFLLELAKKIYDRGVDTSENLKFY